MVPPPNALPVPLTMPPVSLNMLPVQEPGANPAFFAEHACCSVVPASHMCPPSNTVQEPDANPAFFAEHAIHLHVPAGGSAAACSAATALSSLPIALPTEQIDGQGWRACAPQCAPWHALQLAWKPPLLCACASRQADTVPPCSFIFVCPQAPHPRTAPPLVAPSSPHCCRWRSTSRCCPTWP